MQRIPINLPDVVAVSDQQKSRSEVKTMKSTVALVCLMIFSCFTAARAQTPNISHSEPSRLVVEPDALGETTVTLKGSNLVRSDTTGFTFNKDVQVFVRPTTGSGAFEPVRISGWSPAQISVSIDKKTYMSRPDRLEFKIAVRGVGDSNLKTVEVMPYPTAPPQIEGGDGVRAVPSMPLGEVSGVTLRVKNLTADTIVFMRGKEAFRMRIIPGDELLTFRIPEDFQRSGDYYTVQLENRNGKSNTTRVLVVTSPSILSVNPSTIEVDGTGGDQQVKLDFVSLQKPEALVRGEGNSSTWQPVTLSDAGELTIPKSLLAQSGTIEIKLKNIGGEATTQLPVKQVALIIDPNAQAIPKVTTPADSKAIRVIRPSPIKPPPPIKPPQ